MNDVGKPGAGEPHARFDRGPLAKQQPRRAGTDAPTGKPAGLSPATYHSLTSQRPTLPALYQGGWGRVVLVEVQHRLLDARAGFARAAHAGRAGWVGADLEHLDLAEGGPQPGQRQSQRWIETAAATASAGHALGVNGLAKAF